MQVPGTCTGPDPFYEQNRGSFPDPTDLDSDTGIPFKRTRGSTTVFRCPEQQIVYSTKCNVLFTKCVVNSHVPASRVGTAVFQRAAGSGDVPDLPHKDVKCMVCPIRKHRTHNEITGDAP